MRAVLVTGDNGTLAYNETSAMRGYLIEAGIPAVKVVGDHAGFDTYDSCVRAKQVFGVDRAILTSQSYHLPRAVGACRSVGVDAWGVGDDFAPSMDPELWRSYSAREWLANLKLALDLVSRRHRRSASTRPASTRPWTHPDVPPHRTGPDGPVRCPDTVPNGRRGAATHEGRAHCRRGRTQDAAGLGCRSDRLSLWPGVG